EPPFPLPTTHNNFDGTNPPPPPSNKLPSFDVSTSQVTRLILLLILTFWLCGCSPDHYARQADLDVQRLIRDREKQTLEYAPQVELGPSLPREVMQRFDLFASLAYAVQHSRAYQDQMDDLYTTALAVTLQRHLFTPRPFANTSALYTGGQKKSNYKSALTVSNRVGVRQQLPYGGEVVASGLVQFVNAINGNVDD